MLEEALSAATELRYALEAELERASHEREAFRALDSDRIFAGATSRSTFNAEVARLESALAGSLAAACSALGLREVTLGGLARRAPAGASTLCDLLAEIRSLAAGLAEADRLNLALAARAAACVQGYLNALSPVPAAYDRRGLRAAGAIRPVISSKA